jgi:putative transposase
MGVSRTTVPYPYCMGYRTTSGGVSNLKFYLLWRQKYRLPVLTGTAAEDLEYLLREKAECLAVEGKHLADQPDYVHLFVKAMPDYSPAKLAREFMGYTSRHLRQRHKHMTTRMPTLWSRSYYVRGAGHVSDATISRYIEAQGTRKR